MPLFLKTAPTSEPLSLAEIKQFCRLSSYSLSEDITPYSTISPGSHPIGSITGTAIDTLGYIPYIVVDSRSNGTGGTVDLTVKESNDNVTFTTWSGTGFSQITEANDNQFYKLDYTGTMRYLRVDSVTAEAACEFGVNIVLDSPVSADDSIITRIRKTAREAAEQYMSMAFLPQTYQLILNDWPVEDFIKLRVSPVRSITSITYIDSEETSYTFSTDYYYLDANQKPPRAALKYGDVWPTETLRPTGAIIVEFEAGFATLASYQAAMQTNTDNWMLAACHFLYYNRDKQLTPNEFSFKALDFNPYNTRVPFV